MPEISPFYSSFPPACPSLFITKQNKPQQLKLTQVFPNFATSNNMYFLRSLNSRKVLDM